MISKQVLFAVAAAGFQCFSSAAWADDTFPFAAEVDSCVEAVNKHLDLGTAQRVRHVVSSSRRSGIGYVLAIHTSVILEDAEKRYEIRCVAKGSNPPSKLRIDAVET